MANSSARKICGRLFFRPKTFSAKNKKKLANILSAKFQTSWNAFRNTSEHRKASNKKIELVWALIYTKLFGMMDQY